MGGYCRLQCRGALQLSVRDAPRALDRRDQGVNEQGSALQDAQERHPHQHGQDGGGAEAELMELLKERADLCYLCDAGFKDLDGLKAVVGDKWMKRVIVTKKKMGAQTTEANNNAGVAAANQIIGFFEKGETKFSLKA